MTTYTSITYKQPLLFSLVDVTDKFLIESLETGAYADITLIQQEISAYQLKTVAFDNTQPTCDLIDFLSTTINEQNTKDELRDFINSTLVKKWTKLDYPVVKFDEFLLSLRNIDSTVKNSNIDTIILNDIVEFIFLFSNITDTTKQYKIKVPFKVVN